MNLAAHEPIISEELWNQARERDEAKERGERSAKTEPNDEFTYYLRGLVFCPHCGVRMPPVWHKGKNSIVRYYECLKAMKKIGNCPIRRVNASTLHDAILREIERAASHPTRMERLLREAAKAFPEPEDQSSEFKLIERRLVDIDRRIARCQEAIEVSTSAGLLLVHRLEALHTERTQAEAKRTEMASKGAGQKKQRPDIDQVCRMWQRVPELWGKATEDERAELMQALVIKVEMEEKEKGVCEIALAPQTPDHWLELNSGMGAATGLKPTTFRFSSVVLL